jgi:hypothetical protein
VCGRCSTDAHYGITLDRRTELMGMGDHDHGAV